MPPETGHLAAFSTLSLSDSWSNATANATLDLPSFHGADLGISKHEEKHSTVWKVWVTRRPKSSAAVRLHDRVKRGGGGRATRSLVENTTCLDARYRAAQSGWRFLQPSNRGKLSPGSSKRERASKDRKLSDNRHWRWTNILHFFR